LPACICIRESGPPPPCQSRPVACHGYCCYCCCCSPLCVLPKPPTVFNGRPRHRIAEAIRLTPMSNACLLPDGLGDRHLVLRLHCPRDRVALGEPNGPGLACMSNGVSACPRILK
jgi:hypothetical protein